MKFILGLLMCGLIGLCHAQAGNSIRDCRWSFQPQGPAIDLGKYSSVLSKIGGPSRRDPRIRMFLSGQFFFPGSKPVIFIGETASGKSLHVEVASRIFRSEQRRNFILAGNEILVLEDGNSLRIRKSIQVTPFIKDFITNELKVTFVELRAQIREQAPWTQPDSFETYWQVSQMLDANWALDIARSVIPFDGVLMIDYPVLNAENGNHTKVLTRLGLSVTTLDLMKHLIDRQNQGAQGSLISVTPNYYNAHIKGTALESQFEVIELK